MFYGSSLLDFALLGCMVSILKSYFFLVNLNDEEKRFVLYSKTWVRILIVSSIVGEIGYIVGSDIGLLDGKYYIYCLGTYFATIYICALWGIYIGHKHGPKTSEYKESLRIRIQSAIALPSIALLMYFFMG